MDLPIYTQPFKSPPSSKQKTIVFPFSPKGYSLIKYNEALLKDRVTKKDVERVLKAVRPSQPPSKLPAACCVIWFIFLGIVFCFRLMLKHPKIIMRIEMGLLVASVGSCALFTLLFCVMSLR